MSAEFAQQAHDNLLQLKKSLPLDASRALLQSIDDCISQLVSCFALRDISSRSSSSQSLQGQLKRQKTLTAEVEARLLEEFPQRDGDRIASLWHVRVAFAPPNIAARPLSEFLRQFPSNWTEAASMSMAASTVTQTRDAFCELIKMFNVQKLEEMVARYSPAKSAFIGRIHDEVGLRAKTKAVVPDGGQHCQSSVCGRSMSSKVMNQGLQLTVAAETVEHLVELAGMLRKDGPTVTHCLHVPLHTLLGILCKGSEGQVRRVYHLVTGDAIVTNENALKRLYAKNSRNPQVIYYLLGWSCASHQSNICVAVAMHGSDDLLMAICTRWFKYILADYCEELTMNLRKWVWLEMTIHRVDARYCVRLLDNAIKLRKLFGEKVLPDSLMVLCTGELVMSDEGLLREYAFKELYRSFGSNRITNLAFEGLIF